MKEAGIPFNRPCLIGDELENISESIKNKWISGNGPFTQKAQSLLEKQLVGSKRVLLTTSCTHALEMSAILLDLKLGDEVIMPSFTFVSTALAFTMNGAIPVFCDVRNDTFNIDENLLKSLITDRTRAIVPVHYAGVGCEMDVIMEIAQKYGLVVIEDNAHGLYGKYKGKHLGTFGHMATLSFHETKNLICGEGGALIINDPNYISRAETILDKGTNRSQFFRGEIDKYTWVDKGSSYVMSDILAAFLYGQLECADQIQNIRDDIWKRYYEGLEAWAHSNNVRLPIIPEYCDQAYHMFYLLFPSLEERTRFNQHMYDHNISSVFHYLPLHESKMGKKICKTPMDCSVTSDIADRLVRLPFFNDITNSELAKVIDVVTGYNV